MTERNEAAQAIFSLVNALNNAINRMPEGMYAEINIQEHHSVTTAKPVPHLTVIIAETYKEKF